MPNEFVIKNGFISKGNSIVEGGITATTISASTISGGTFYGDGSNLTGISSGGPTIYSAGTGVCSTVRIGVSNTTNGNCSTISGGFTNTTLSIGDFIGGGSGNTTFSTLSGGYNFVGGGGGHGHGLPQPARYF
jgi:hypothetical protein